MGRVSVCVPVYNPGRYLRPALDSILAQNAVDFDVAVVDDCSDEPIEALVRGHADERLSLHRNKRRLGLVGNWNHCLELARGEYVTIFHQDDVMRPGNLYRKASLLDTHPEIGFVYSNSGRIDATGSQLGEYGVPQPTKDAISPGWRLFQMVAETGNPVPCPGVMVRADCYRSLGLFDPRVPFAADLEMWLRLASKYDFGYLADRLVSVRVHAAQETARFSATGRDYEDVLRALDLVRARVMSPECMHYLPDCYRTLARQARAMARWNMRDGHLGTCLRYARVWRRATERAASRTPNGGSRTGKTSFANPP